MLRDWCPFKRTEEEGHVTREAETREMQPQAKNPRNHQSRVEARTDFPPEALEGAQLCRHLEFGLPASRIGRE